MNWCSHSGEQLDMLSQTEGMLTNNSAMPQLGTHLREILRQAYEGDLQSGANVSVTYGGRVTGNLGALL